MPPVAGLREASSRMNGWKTSSRSSAGMPGPSSSTRISTPSPRRQRATAIVLRVAAGVGDQVGEAAPQARPAAAARISSPSAGELRSSAPSRRAGADDLLEQRREVGLDRRLACPRRGRRRDSRRPSAPSRRRRLSGRRSRRSSPSIASASFMRVSGVRRSWETPASISVRWGSGAGCGRASDEGGAGLAHLERALDAGRRRRRGPCRSLGGAGQPADRPHLVAQEQRPRPRTAPATSRPSTG